MRIPFMSRSCAGASPRGARRRLAVCSAVSLAVAAGACAGEQGGQGGPAVAVSDSAGIRIVENVHPDAPEGRRPAKVNDLVPPDSALSPVPWGVAADPVAGQVYVLDDLGRRVVVFDQSGQYAATYGRQGGGPGEFRNPSALSTGPDGTVTVWDTGRGVLSRWSGKGEFLAEEREPAAYWGPGFVERGDRMVTVTSRSSGLELTQMLVELTAADTVPLHSVVRELVMMELPGIRQPAPRLFSPDLVWTAGADRIYVLDSPEYRIDAYSGGNIVSSYRRRVDPIRVTEALAIERVSFGQYAGFVRSTGLTPQQIVDAVGYEEVASPVQWIAVDPAGRLWVTRSPNGIVPQHVDILDADGRYEGTIEAPGIPVAFLSRSRFVSLSLSQDTGLPGVSLYELRSDDGAVDSPATEPEV